MFGSTVLDVAIGMVLVYLLLSLICSSIKEGIAGILKLRARTLEKGVADMFAGPEGTMLKQELYHHPLIRGLTQQGKLIASYIPSRTFALALLDTIYSMNSGPSSQPISSPKSFQDVRLAIENMPGNEIKGALLPLLDTAGENLNKANDAIAGWFDDAMDRVSGQYKRRSQAIILLLAVVLCGWLNVDSIAIADSLWQNPTQRQLIVSTAEQTTRSPYKETGASQQSAQKELEQLKLPIGWDHTPKSVSEWLMKTLGLLITALAISLNAPFWFDLLNKLVNLRLSGARPDTVAESKQKNKTDA